MKVIPFLSKIVHKKGEGLTTGRALILKKMS